MKSIIDRLDERLRALVGATGLKGFTPRIHMGYDKAQCHPANAERGKGVMLMLFNMLGGFVFVRLLSWLMLRIMPKAKSRKGVLGAHGVTLILLLLAQGIASGVSGRLQPIPEHHLHTGCDFLADV
jgi:hypothetical protein